ncbi:N-acetylneuraminate synthase [Holdemania filiformis]|uniref:N-acetylneuraminate synthase n=1 Tax=Holdemania filiformis TaxID=61171 RepID=UPI00242C94C4|nr:N-acetylneuraminate synthase [Holdemania filiformis]
MIKIVAEIGCNHNGNYEIAKKLVLEASLAGADAVKFQTFNAEDLVSPSAPKAEYQEKDNVNESQLEMLEKLELSQEEYLEVKKYAEDLGLEVFSTPFDSKAVEFLYNIGQKIWKIPSGEITNLPYLEKIRDLECSEKEIILSTGMSTMDEIEAAVDILQQSKNTKFIILHCNTEYPTQDIDMNLKALNVLKKQFPMWDIGLSDHSEGIVAAVTAVSMGVQFIEKHFTLDKNLSGPDHKASIIPDELKELCVNVRRAEVMLGKEMKFITSSENKNRYIARKSIVAKKTIKKGELFSIENLTCKRPGSGISPMHWYDLLGKTALQDFEQNDLIRCEGIKWENEN